MHAFLRYATQKRRETVSLIGTLVGQESPSDSPADIARLLELLIEQTRDLASAKLIRCDAPNRCLRLDFKISARNASTHLLGLGHVDTVWPQGTLKQMPFREAKGRLWGPGVLDMKAGLAFFLTAARLLRDLDVATPRRVSLLVVPDEETGSLHSRSVTETEARKSAMVLVLEPGTGLEGKLKTARKGIGRYTVTVHGKAAHAGVDFDSGASAIVELARQIRHISEMTDAKSGITVNPGVIRGGTRSNVVAAEASVEVDVRAVRMKDALKLDRHMRALRARDKRCSVMVEGGLNRPPMERTDAIRGLYKRASVIAEELGISLEESSTGGGSDGNFTAALGIPTLDGLGGVGEGAHAPHESILTSRIADRVALLAGLLAKL